MKLNDFIASLSEQDFEEITREFKRQKNRVPTYAFSQLEHKDLKRLFDIERVFKEDAFDFWFDAGIVLKDGEVHFLEKLLGEEINFLRIYNEEDLKVHFISPILNRVNFKSIENRLRDFYEETLVYETGDFILKGAADFLVAKGLEYPEQPYFFIQEFKKGLQFSNPEPQLLAEMVCALELSDFERIKGAYIVGESWNFVILDKLAANKYRHVVSRTFNAGNIVDLLDIYKNLLFVRQEIMQWSAS